MPFRELLQPAACKGSWPTSLTWRYLCCFLPARSGSQNGEATTMPSYAGARLLSSSIFLLPSRSQSSLPLTQHMRGAGCFPSLGKDAVSLPADLLRKTQWCLGLAEVFFGQNAQRSVKESHAMGMHLRLSREQPREMCGWEPRVPLPCLVWKHKPSVMNLPTAWWFSCKRGDIKHHTPASPQPLQLGFGCFEVSCGV